MEAQLCKCGWPTEQEVEKIYLGPLENPRKKGDVFVKIIDYNINLTSSRLISKQLDSFSTKKWNRTKKINLTVVNILLF